MSTLWLCINNQKQTMQHICPQNCYLKEEKSVIKKFVHCFNSAANYSSFLRLLLFFTYFYFISKFCVFVTVLCVDHLENIECHTKISHSFFIIIIRTLLNLNCSCVNKYYGLSLECRYANF